MTIGSHHPRVLGVPGGGLNNATFLHGKSGGQATARVGKAGEVRTAAILNALAEPDDGPTVLHDLMVPSGKYKANIDHVVVSGRTVHIIDAKVWKPAFYWTLAGQSRRGGSRFEPAEKKTMVVARKCVEAYLASLGITAKVITPTLVVWPSSTRGRLSLWALKVPGAHSWHATTFERRIEKMHGNGGIGPATRKPADPNIVAALTALLVTKPRGWTETRLKQQTAHLTADQSTGPTPGAPAAAAPDPSLPPVPPNPVPNRRYSVPEPTFDSASGAVSATADPIFGDALTPPPAAPSSEPYGEELPDLQGW